MAPALTTSAPKMTCSALRLFTAMLQPQVRCYSARVPELRTRTRTRNHQQNTGSWSSPRSISRATPHQTQRKKDKMLFGRASEHPSCFAATPRLYQCSGYDWRRATGANTVGRGGAMPVHLPAPHLAGVGCFSRCDDAGGHGIRVV